MDKLTTELTKPAMKKTKSTTKTSAKPKTTKK